MSPLVMVSIFGLASAGQCFFGSTVYNSTEINGTCYWTVKSVGFTSWDSALTACSSDGGVIATINSQLLNDELASWLDKPAFIGYYKASHFSFLWVNGSDKIIYRNDPIAGDHLLTNHVILDLDSSWKMVAIDAEDVETYHVLCSIVYEKLRCPQITVKEANVLAERIPAYFRDSVTVVCNPWHQSNAFGQTVQVTTCVKGASWSHNVTDCYRKPVCPPPPIVEYAEVSNENMVNNTVTVSYKCQKGWTFPTGEPNKVLTCDGNDMQWGPTAILSNLTCVERRCDLTGISKGTNVAIGNYNSTRVGSIVTYWCEDGFQLEKGGSRITIECMDVTCKKEPCDNLASPYWSFSTISSCVAKRCKPQQVANAKIGNSAASSELEVGQSIIYQCTANTQFPGGATIHQTRCLEVGEWNSQPPLSGCSGGQCEDGWVRRHSSCYYISQSESHGLRYDPAKASCEEKQAHLATVRDEEEKNFFASVYADHERDFWIGYHKTVDNLWVWHDGSNSSNYENFAPGYPELHGCARTSVDGVWKDRLCNSFLSYICEKPAVCGNPPSAANSILSVIKKWNSTYRAGEVVYYLCRAGFSLINGSVSFSSTCLEGGVWTWVDSCTETVCPSLNSPGWQVENSYLDNTYATHYNAKVIYICVRGFIFPDGSTSASITCRSNRTWSRKPDDCKAVQCLAPATHNALVSSHDHHFGAMTKYTCIDGYRFQDGSKAQLFWCGDEGLWLPSQFQCKAVQCPRYYIPHARISGGSEFSFGDEITVTCLLGYKLNNSNATEKIMTCSNSSNWLGDDAKCTARYCDGPFPPNVKNAFRDTNALLGGTKIRYTCARNHLFADGSIHKESRCDPQTLKWILVPDGCIDHEEYMTANLFVYPDHVLIQSLNLACIAFGACAVLLGLFKVLAVALDGSLMRELYKPEAEFPQTDLAGECAVNGSVASREKQRVFDDLKPTFKGQFTTDNCGSSTRIRIQLTASECSDRKDEEEKQIHERTEELKSVKARNAFIESRVSSKSDSVATQEKNRMEIESSMNVDLGRRENTKDDETNGLSQKTPADLEMKMTIIATKGH